MEFKEAIISFLRIDYRMDETALNILVDKTPIKGSLNEDFVVLTANKGQEVSVFSRHQFEIIPESASLKQKETAVKVRVGQQWVTGRIDSTSYERYQQWELRKD
jgi:hypothetical protein